GGHAQDADNIVGDNGRILRLVGVNKTQRANGTILGSVSGSTNINDGVSSSGGFLNYNYDVYGTAADGYSANTTVNGVITYNRIIARAVEFLDYHEGGIDWTSAAASDVGRGGADEIHGESGDDVIYAQQGNDIVYGDGQDDDIIGGYGNDWIDGGTG